MTSKISLVTLGPEMDYTFLDSNRNWSENLGLTICNSYLGALGYETDYINTAISLESDKQVIDRIVEMDSAFAFLSATVYTIGRAFDMAQVLKKNGVRTVLGGHHATLNAEEIFSSNEDIFGILGGYMENYSKGYLDSCLSGKRFVVKSDLASEIHTPLVRPDIAHLDEGIVQMESSRGCYFDCTFCTTPGFSSGKWRTKEVKDVLQEYDLLVEKYRDSISMIQFVDDVHFWADENSRVRMNDLVQGLLDRNNELPIWFMTRAHVIANTPVDLLEQMFEAGYSEILMGFESFDESLVNSVYGKRNNVNEFNDVIDCLKRIGYKIDYGMIPISPYASFNSFSKDLEFLYRNGELGYRLEILSRGLNVIPGTTIAKRMNREGLLPGDYSHLSDPTDYSFLDPRFGQFARRFSAIVGENRDPSFVNTLEFYRCKGEYEKEFEYLNQLVCSSFLQAVSDPDDINYDLLNDVIVERANVINGMSYEN